MLRKAGLVALLFLLACRQDEPFLVIRLAAPVGTNPPVAEVLDVTISATVGGAPKTETVQVSTQGNALPTAFSLSFDPALIGVEMKVSLIGRAGGQNLFSGEATATVGDEAEIVVQFCGDRIAQANRGEQCDDGNTQEGDACDSNCTPPVCGNGILDESRGEQCDDGNFDTEDGCDPNCTIPGCGNGIVTSGEECDDGNIVNGDTCDVNCTVPGCGNGVFDPGEICFQTPRRFPVGASPVQIVSGDFNGDGLPDLAVANSGADFVSVLLNQGGSELSFEDSPVSVSSGPVSIAVGTLNGDSLLDLVTSNQTSSIDVLLGSNDGTFLTPIALSATANVNAITVSDLTGEGRAEVIAAGNFPGGEVEVFLSGSSGFSNPQDFSAGGGIPLVITSGDFTQDNRADVVVANPTLLSQDPPPLTLLRGQPNPLLSAPSTLLTGAIVAERDTISVVDADEDGRLDLLFAGNSQEVSLLLGRGNGQFDPRIDLPVGAFPTAVSAGDLNLDGAPELLLTSTENKLLILPGLPGGGFGAVRSFFTDGDGSTALVLADFNVDGFLDVAVVNQQSSDLSVFLFEP